MFTNKRERKRREKDTMKGEKRHNQAAGRPRPAENIAFSDRKHTFSRLKTYHLTTENLQPAARKPAFLCPICPYYASISVYSPLSVLRFHVFKKSSCQPQAAFPSILSAICPDSGQGVKNRRQDSERLQDDRQTDGKRTKPYVLENIGQRNGRNYLPVQGNLRIFAKNKI